MTRQKTLMAALLATFYSYAFSVSNPPMGTPFSTWASTRALQPTRIDAGPSSSQGKLPTCDDATTGTNLAVAPTPKVCGIVLDLDALSYTGFQLDEYDPQSGESTNIADTEQGGTFELAPGHFRIASQASNTSMYFSVTQQCQVSPDVEWRIGLEASTALSPMHAEFFEVEAETLRLLSTPIQLRMALAEGQTASLLAFGNGEAALQHLQTHVHNLSPGQYTIEVTTASAVARLRFEVLNATGRLQNFVQWQDVAGNQTNGVMVSLPAGVVYLEPDLLSSAKTMPFQFPDAPLPYAILKDQLDGDYYLAIGGELRIRYDERYATSDPLKLRILDMNHNEIALPTPVARAYGSNWITLQLPSSSFNIGDYYVLEVRGPRGDLSMLRFRYDQ